MLIPLLGGYILGGLLCGVLLSIWYGVCVVRGLRRSPWSFILGSGWLLLLMGVALWRLGDFTPQKNYSWQNGWGDGCMGIGFGLWWLASLIFLIMRRRQQLSPRHEAQCPNQPSEGVWPPAPAVQPSSIPPDNITSLSDPKRFMLGGRWRDAVIGMIIGFAAFWCLCYGLGDFIFPHIFSRKISLAWECVIADGITLLFSLLIWYRIRPVYWYIANGIFTGSLVVFFLVLIWAWLLQ